MSGAHEFLAELRRRHVWRVAAAYAVVGWLLIEIATQVFPVFHMPDWAAQLVVLLIVLGFPVAVSLAWAFEMTPEGVRRTEPVHSPRARSHAQARRVGRYLKSLVVASLSVAAGVLVWRQLMPGPAASHSAAASGHAKPVATARATSSMIPDNAGVPAKSIAVLPFANLSTDKANAYFADGIQEEILNGLTRMGDLKVISRSSTRHYASRPDNLTEIARQLGVATLLQGSVQKADNRVRVNVQLVNAQSNTQLWAQTYDSTLTDVFAAESAIARKIANTLKVELSGGERAAVDARGTDNVAAHDAYLRGLAFESRGTESSADVQRQAEEMFAEAVRLDPDYALAWARLAIVRSYMYLNFIDRTPSQADEVRQAAETALRLQPELGEARLALGYYRYRCLRDFAGALREFELARQRLPNNADVISAIAYVERRQGKWQASISHLEQAIALDPRETARFLELSINYSALREFARARATLDRGLRVEPGLPGLIAAKAGTWLRQGKLKQADELMSGVTLSPADGDALRSRLKLLWYRRDLAGMARVLDDALTGSKESLGVYRLYYLLAWAGDRLWAGDEAAARGGFQRVVTAVGKEHESGAGELHLAQVMAFARAGLGDKAAALREARRAVALAADDALMKPDMQIPLAQIQAHFGDTDAALAALPHLLAVPGGVTVAELRLDPLWDPLRGDPRFRALLNGRGKDGE